MLEFLGLEDEAMKVLVSCIILGAVIGIQSGILSADTKGSEGKVKAGPVIFLVICILAGVYALFTGFLPAVVLFFTFQWKALLWCVFLGLTVAAVTFFIGNRVVQWGRRRKYMRNPIIREAVEFCRKNEIVGIQCFDDSLRFFQKLEDPDYCRSSVRVEKKKDASESEEYQKNWSREESWIAYDRPLSYVGTLKFADRDYPNVPDLPMFASALARKAKGFGYARHFHSVQYDTVSYSGNTRTTTHHITVLHSDCFVYNRAACRRCKREWKKLGLNRRKRTEKVALVKKPNTWE